MQRILDAAAGIFGKAGYDGATMLDVARAAGVSKGLLHYHFKSKEQLLIEAQRATFRRIAQRFESRSQEEETGLAMGLDALDALWEAVLDMRDWAPFMLETMSMATQNKPTRKLLDRFYEESMDLLEQGLKQVLGKDTQRLLLPPDRLSFLIRSTLEGLVVELAYSRNPTEVERVEQAYQDFRTMFEKVILEEGS
jgi:AcrR family transcriptional regulator